MNLENVILKIWDQLGKHLQKGKASTSPAYVAQKELSVMINYTSNRQFKNQGEDVHSRAYL